MKTLQTAQEQIRAPDVPDRELDFREGGGVQVRLWHRPGTDRPQLYVTVSSDKADIPASIEVPRPDQANRIFMHALACLSEKATRMAFDQELGYDQA